MTQSKKRLGLAVPESLYQDLRQKAEYHGKTINSTCLDIFWWYFENQKKERDGQNGERRR